MNLSDQIINCGPNLQLRHRAEGWVAIGNVPYEDPMLLAFVDDPSAATVDRWLQITGPYPKASLAQTAGQKVLGQKRPYLRRSAGNHTKDRGFRKRSR